MTQKQFIEEVAKYVQKYAPQYGIKVYSPIIAQFCLESGYGTSNKVKKILSDGTVDWRHNYAGLKWRNNRCAISNDYFEEGTAEQNADGTYNGIVSKFFRFKSLEGCVIGYFQFTNIPAYANLKGVTDPETYLKNIKDDKYATSIDYVQKNMNVIKTWNLTQYDTPTKDNTNNTNNKGGNSMTKIIGLDRGHGLKTSGKQTPDGIKEWTLNDAVADKVVELLSNYDVKIIHTDNDEGYTDESLTSRRTMYVNQKVDAFVSIHHNANTGTWNSATGVEIYTDKNPTSKDVALANAIYKNFPIYTGLKGRGIKQANFTVINQNSVPAVLCEGGFMDGTNDYKVITSSAGQLGYAKAVAEGLISFLGLVKKSNTITPTPTPTPSTAPSTNSVNTGDSVNLSNTPVYTSATSSSCSSKKTGTYYIWSNVASNGRVRITNAKNRVGVAGQITGWVNLTDIGTTVSNISTSTATAPSIQKYVYSGVDYSLVFDPTYYANNYSDLKSAFGTNASSLWNHFKTYGMKEHRQASSNFNPVVYRNNYKDLNNAFGDNWAEYYKHYIQYGQKEKRSAV